MLPYACFDLFNFKTLTRYEQCNLYKTTITKGYDPDLYNLNIKHLNQYNYLFDLKPRMIKFLSMYFAKININNLSNESIKLRSVISTNIRIHNISRYQQPLNDITLHAFTHSGKVGFCVIATTRIPRSIYSILTKHWITIKSDSLTLHEAKDRIELGEVIILTKDIYQGQLETYIVNTGLEYPSLLEHIDCMKYVGNHLQLRYFGNNASDRDTTSYYNQLFRSVVTRGFSSAAVVSSSDETRISAINGTYLLRFHISSNVGIYEHEIISDIYVDTSEFDNFNIYKAQFDLSFRCLNDDAVSHNFANLLFRGHSYELDNKLVVMDNTEYIVKLDVIRQIDAFSVGCDNPIRNIVNGVLQSPSNFITLVGPKGSGKSRFIKDFKEIYDDYFVVDSDVYGSYVSYLLRFVLKTDKLTYSTKDYDQLKELHDDFVDYSTFVDALKYAQIHGDEDAANYFPNALIAIINNLNGDYHHSFMDYVVQIYDHKILGLKKFQDVVRYCATVQEFRHIMMFAHTSIESYFNDVDLELVINPTFNEFTVIAERSRVYDLIPRDDLDIELALNVVYSQYISKKNSYGWQFIYKLLQIPNYVDLTDYCVNYRYNYMNDFTDEEIGIYRVYRLPSYMPAMPLTNKTFNNLRGAILLPIGHGKSTISRINPLFIQIDDAFSKEELVILNDIAHCRSYLYLTKVFSFFCSHYQKGSYNNKVLLYHDLNIAKALGIQVRAKILSDRYMHDSLQYKLSNDKFTSMVSNVNEVLESNVLFEIYDSHDALSEALVGSYR